MTHRLIPLPNILLKPVPKLPKLHLHPLTFLIAISLVSSGMNIHMDIVVVSLYSCFHMSMRVGVGNRIGGVGTVGISKSVTITTLHVVSCSLCDL